VLPDHDALGPLGSLEDVLVAEGEGAETDLELGKRELVSGQTIRLFTA
jgi:hypothetical protein